MAEPTAGEVRWSRIAAAAMVLLGAAVVTLGALASDERLQALGYVVGAPTLAIGAVALAYTRIGPHVPDQWRRRGSGRR